MSKRFDCGRCQKTFATNQKLQLHLKKTIQCLEVLSQTTFDPSINRSGLDLNTYPPVLHLREFGKDLDDAVSTSVSFPSDMLKYVSSGADGFLEYIKYIYFSPARPFHQSLRKIDSFDGFMQIFDGFIWKQKNANQCLGKIYKFVQGDFKEAFKINKRIGALTQEQMTNVINEVGIPLAFGLDDVDDAVNFVATMHVPLRDAINKRVLDLIFEQTKLLESTMTHPVDTYPDGCQCIRCVFDQSIEDPFFESDEDFFWSDSDPEEYFILGMWRD